MLPDLPNPIDGARNLLGWTLLHHTPSGNVGGIIIETEAYQQDDEASHLYVFHLRYALVHEYCDWTKGTRRGGINPCAQANNRH
jgi:hypothetical protein